MNEQELLDLKERIDEAKTKVSELKGSKNQLMKDLKNNWECSTTEAAEKKIKKIETEVASLNTQIQTGTAELEEKYINKEEE